MSTKMTTLRMVGAAGLAAAALAAVANASSPSTVVTTAHTSLGTVLVTSAGKTLYLDTSDKPPKFACTGGCLKAWPPLKAVGTVKAAGSAKASLLGTVKGPSGKTVTYNGHPLYTYSGDTKTGETTSQNLKLFGAKWYVVSVAGTAITKG